MPINIAERLRIPGITEQLVRESYEKSQNQAGRRNAEIMELEDFYRGGAHVKPYLSQYEGEREYGKWQSYADRQDRVDFPNYFSMIVDAYISGVYGGTIVRNLNSGNDTTDAKLLEWFDASSIEDQEDSLALSMVLWGDGVAYYRWDPAKMRVVIAAKRPDVLVWELSSSDPTEFGWIKERRDIIGSKNHEHWLWTPDWLHVFGDNMEPLPFDIVENGQRRSVVGPIPNPYRPTIPYQLWPGRHIPGDDYGISLVADALDGSKTLLNWSSEWDQAIHKQVMSTLVVRGELISRIKTGPKNALGFRDPTGDARYINPGTDIMTIVESVERKIKQIAHESHIPLAILLGGEAANSGFMVQLQWAPFLRRVNWLKRKAEASEVSGMRKIATIARAHQVPISEDITPTVTFPDTVIPTDTDADFERDTRRLDNGTMDPRVYVQRWDEDWTGATLDEIGVYLTDAQEWRQKIEGQRNSVVVPDDGGLF